MLTIAWKLPSSTAIADLARHSPPGSQLHSYYHHVPLEPSQLATSFLWLIKRLAEAPTCLEGSFYSLSKGLSLNLAEEAPEQFTHTPIAPDHPSTSTLPTLPPFPVLSALASNYSATQQNLGASENPTLPTLASATLSDPLSVQGSPQVGTRRRRRESSSDTREGEQSNPRTRIHIREDGSQPQEPTSRREVRRRREGPSSPKRQRLVGSDMRLDTDSTNGNSNAGANGARNGTALLSQKLKSAAATNDHAHSTNGVATYTNGTAPGKSKRMNWFGHDREEVTRLLIQGLNDLGYRDTADRLVRESGFELEIPAVAAFREAVLRGDWAEAESLLFGAQVPDTGGGVSISNDNATQYHGLELADGVDRDELKFELRRQKYLELLEKRDLGGALMVLRQELTPLNQDTGQLHVLSSLIVCQSADDLISQAGWDGAYGLSRNILLAALSKSISPSVMIPDHRLAVLLDQVKQNQISRCLYHNPTTSPSLFSDHMCDRSQFPLETIYELSESAEEVWFLEFSHDGKMLATSGKDNVVVIYDTTTFQVRHKLTEHKAFVVYLSWSPDDSKIISCSGDKKARVWDTTSGHCTLALDRHGETVTSAAWAPSGDFFVTGSFDKRAQLCLWNLTGQNLYTWSSEYRVQDCAMSPDGRWLVTISPEREIIVYNFDTREEEYCLRLKTKSTCVNISRDSKYMLVNMADNELQLFDINTAEVIRRFSGQKQGEYVIRSCFGGADENLVISGSEDGRVYIWHKENGNLIETLEGHTGGCVSAVAWNPADTCMFASAGDDRKVRIWSKESAVHSSRRRDHSNGSSRSNFVRSIQSVSGTML
ncbi:MAG: hypothetical protein MMC33_002947 [Icmadophila ericetorum]|nr:hypothetical protein [Icmadophila ericetorum]